MAIDKETILQATLSKLRNAFNLKDPSSTPGGLDDTISNIGKKAIDIGAGFQRSIPGIASVGLKKAFIDAPVEYGKRMGDWAYKTRLEPNLLEVGKSALDYKLPQDLMKIAGSVAAVGTPAGGGTLLSYGGLRTALGAGFRQEGTVKERTLGALRETAKDIPSILPKAGLYAATNALTGLVMPAAGFTKRAIIAGLSNVGEDVITSKLLGWDPNMTPTDYMASFLVPGVFMGGATALKPLAKEFSHFGRILGDVISGGKIDQNRLYNILTQPLKQDSVRIETSKNTFKLVTPELIRKATLGILNNDVSAGFKEDLKNKEFADLVLNDLRSLQKQMGSISFGAKVGGEAESPLEAEARKYKSAEEFVNIAKTKSINTAKTKSINLPIEKIGGLEPQPAPFPKTKRQILDPVKVVLTNQGDYILEEGNHRYHQAVFNKDKTIPAKIRFEEGMESRLTDIYNQAKGEVPKTQVDGKARIPDITDSVKALRDSLSKTDYFGRSKSEILSYKNSLDKSVDLENLGSRKAKLYEEAKSIGLEAWRAHEAGDMELRNSLNAKKADTLREAEDVVKSVEKEVASSPIKETVIKTKKSVEAIVENVATSLNTKYPSRKQVADSPDLAKTAFVSARGELYSLVDSVQKKLTSTNSTESFVNALNGTSPETKEMGDLISKHKGLLDSLRKFSENKMGYIENYFPHESGILGLRDEVALFGDSFISRFNLQLGHTKSRTGAMDIDYSREYSSVMKNYIDQMLYTKYGDFIGTKKIEQEILHHVKSLEGVDYSGFDYVDRLNKLSGGAAEIEDHEITEVGKVSKGYSLRTANDEFSKMSPKIHTAFTGIRDSYFEFNKTRDLLKEDIANRDVNSIVDFFFSKTGLPEERREAFTNTSLRLIGTDSLNKYVASASYKMLIQRPKQIFLDTIKNVEFSNQRTKDYVNRFVEKELSSVKYTEDLLDKMTKILATAQIGGNLKVALVQGTEIGTLPTHYGFANTSSGIFASITDKKRLSDMYGFKEVSLDYDVSPRMGVGEILKGVPNKIRKVLYKPVAFMENWKNAVFIGAAESAGIKKGLEGDELVKFVRDEIFAKAHIADKYNTPEILQNESFYRSALMYSQFGFKSMFEAYDEVASKNYSKAAALVFTRAMTAVLMAKLVGIPAKWALQGLLPSFGPILQLPGQILGYLMEARDEDSDVRQKYYLNKAAMTVAKNIIPGGAQLYKTGSYLSNLDRGYTTTPSERLKFPVSKTLPNIVKGAVFGIGATSESKDYYGGDTPTISENRQRYITESGDIKGTYDEVMGWMKSAKNTDDIAEGMEKSGVNSLVFEKDFLYKNDDNKVMSMKIPPKPAEADKVNYAKWEKDAYAKSNTILEVTSLSEEDKSAGLEALGINREDADYYNIASEINYIKAIHVKEIAQNILSTTKDRQKMIQALVDMRKEVANKMILTSGVITELVSAGIITKAEGTTLRKVKFDDVGGVPTAYVTGRGASAKLKKVKFVPLKYASKTAPKVSRISGLKSPITSSGSSVNLSSIKAQKLEIPKYKVRFNV